MSFSSEWFRIRLITNRGTPPLAIRLAAVRRRSWARMSTRSRPRVDSFASHLQQFAAALCGHKIGGTTGHVWILRIARVPDASDLLGREDAVATRLLRRLRHANDRIRSRRHEALLRREGDDA
jgi:hypothetical protein